MSSKISIILKAIFALFSLVLTFCTPEACFEETNSFVKASFYQNATGKYLAPDSITLYGSSMETSKLYNRARYVQPALMPLNSATDNCTLIIRINGIADTLTMTYSSYPHLISKECGYTFYHILDSYIVTKNIIDTIIIRNRSITTVNEENIRIFY